MAAAELWENSLAEPAPRVLYYSEHNNVGRYIKRVLKQTYENLIFCAYKATSRIIL